MGTVTTLMPLWVVSRGAKYGLSGTVADGGGTGIESVTITITGDASTSTTTAADGTWSFSGATKLKPGSYTVTPTKTNYTFYPTSSAQTITNAAITGVDFVSTAWLLYDEFTTADANPLTTPRTAEPGPGSWNVIDTDSKFSISSEKLQAATGGGNYSRITAVDALTRGAGLCVAASADAVGGAYWFVGLDKAGSNNAPPYGDYIRLQASGGYNCTCSDGGVISGIAMTYPTINGIILRSTGCFFFSDGTLLWASPAVREATATLPKHAVAVNIFQTDWAGALSLPANGYSEWDADFSMVTDSETNPANGTTFDCAADCHLRMTHTCENTKYVHTDFRFTDSSNYVSLEIDSSRVPTLKKNVAGTPSTLATFAALTDAVEYQFDIVAEGTSVKVFQDNVLKTTQTVADHATVTGGNVNHDLASNDIVLSTHPYPALGIATDRVIAPQQADTVTHAADALIYFRNITLTTGSTDFHTIRRSGGDYIRLDFPSDGDFTMRRFAGGIYQAPNLINTGAATMADGDDVAVIFDGADAEVFVNGTSVGSTAAAPYTSNTGYIMEDRADGSEDSIEFFPRDVTSLLPNEVQ